MSAAMLGYATRQEAAAAFGGNPNAVRIGRLADGSWAICWANGAVTGRDAKRLAPKRIRWASAVITVSIEVTEEQRRRLALHHACASDRASDDEMRFWAQAELGAWLMSLEGEEGQRHAE